MLKPAIGLILLSNNGKQKLEMRIKRKNLPKRKLKRKEGRVSNMVSWILSIYAVSIVGGGLWLWYLHNKGELVSEYPYSDEM